MMALAGYLARLARFDASFSLLLRRRGIRRLPARKRRPLDEARVFGAGLWALIWLDA